MSELCAPLMLDLVELRRRTWYLSPVALSAYLTLIDYQWFHGSLPSEDHDLADACRVSVYVFRRWKGQLSTLFDHDADGRWYDAGLGRRRVEALAALGKASITETVSLS